MKKYLVLALMIGVSSFAWAADASFKIAIVDQQTVLQKSPQMSDASAQLDKQFKPRQQEIMDLQNDLQKDVEKLNKENTVMKPEDRQGLQDKIMTKRTKLQTMLTSFKQDLDSAQQKAYQRITDKFNSALSKVAQDGNYDIILLKQAAPYSKGAKDVTDDVIRGMAR